MSTRLRALPLAAGILWMGCDTLLRITVEESGTTVIEAGTPLETFLGDFGFGDFTDLDITAAEELQNQGVQPGDISTVTVETFTLRSIDGADLSFLDDVTVWVEAPDLERVTIATASDFPAGTTEVAFTLEDVDLADYVVSEAMTIGTDVTGSRPREQTTIEAAIALSVGVTTQGACNYIKGE